MDEGGLASAQRARRPGGQPPRRRRYAEIRDSLIANNPERREGLKSAIKNKEADLFCFLRTCSVSSKKERADGV